MTNIDRDPRQRQLGETDIDWFQEMRVDSLNHRNSSKATDNGSGLGSKNNLNQEDLKNNATKVGKDDGDFLG